MNPLLLTDGYKLSHRVQYPIGTSLVYSNWTPRQSRIKGVDKVVNFGLQYFIKEYLIDRFNEDFFEQPKDKICSEYKKEVESYLGCKYDVSHIESLHDLGYLPIEIKSLPEGCKVPIGVPMFTIVNTLPEFFWITNYLETLISNVVWKPMTSATISNEYRKLFEKWAEKTGSKSDIIPDVLNNIDIQGHDFSMRGMSGAESALMSGMGHLLSFKGTDTIPAIVGLKKYYNGENDFVGCSVPATEHSVMCSGKKDDEFLTFKRLITEIYPTGILSIVSDTWDLWKVLTDYLPRLKNEILARDGKVVIRPDSGDPVDIVCGSLKGRTGEEKKGVVELLWDIFGGTIVNGSDGKEYKVLDPHIGCIYGDSITIERAENICSRLADKGFASTNWVAGIGSYTYQYNTRDTFGFAMKSTYIEIDTRCRENCGKYPCLDECIAGHTECRQIFKEPVTGDGLKKSAKGLLYVQHNIYNGDYELIDCIDWDMEVKSELKTVFKDGKLIVDETLSKIRERIKEK